MKLDVEVIGLLTFRGYVYSFAYINFKVPDLQALANIKVPKLT